MKKSHVIPTSVNKRLISTLMSTRKVDPNENKNFALKSTSDFASRSGDVFGKLHSLEKSHENWISENKTLECFDDSDEHGLSEPIIKAQNKPDTKAPNKAEFEIVPKKTDSVKKPDSEAVFKKPFPARSLKRKTSSNFGKQPKKWTKYSLEDVPISSDATNAAAAFQFLNELKSRKEQKVDTDDNTDKIVFKKPKQKEHNTASHSQTRVVLAVRDDTSQSCSGEPKVSSECKTSGNVMLAHLEEEEEL